MRTLADKLTALLRICSITGSEAELCAFVQSFLEQQSKDARLGLRLERLGDSLVVRAAADTARPTLVLAGHLDTVPGVAFGEKVRSAGDQVYGLGASDMKSGLAVMLELLRPELLQRARFNLVEIFYAGEEGPHSANGLHQILQQCADLKQAELCILLEPTDNTLQLGCMGSLHAQVSFIGKRAHSARPWQGSNAINLALPFLQKVLGMEKRVQMVAGLEFYELISVTMAHTGDNASNVIPDLFTLNLNCRFAPGREVASVKREVTELAQGQAKIEFSDACPSGPVLVGNQWLDELARSHALKIEPKQAYTDVALFAQHGIPALNFGPGLPAQAHQSDEFVEFSKLVRSYQVLSTFISGN